MLTIQFSGINHIHNVVQPLPLSCSVTFINPNRNCNHEAKTLHSPQHLTPGNF